MPNLLVRPHQPDEMGRIIDITPESAGWEYVGFKVFQLKPGQKVSAETGAREVCLVLLSGKATVTAGGETFAEIGERESVFDNIKPYAVYVPNNSEYTVEALTDLEISESSAPGAGTYGVRLIRPEDVKRLERGAGTNSRIIHDILMANGKADSLLITEVFTPHGNWSSYPSHRHDVDDPPNISKLEETYFHKTNPKQGFAIQRVYTDNRDLDETMTADYNNVVLVPRGYHPVGAPYGYDLYYLNTMAGPKREWIFHNDPDHAWIVEAQKEGSLA